MIRRAFSFVTEDLNEKAVVMKKIFTWVIVLILAVCSLSFGACDKDKGGKFTFCVPDGAPALAVAKFIKDKENFGEKYEFDYKVVAAGNIGGIMQKGESDFIVMPVNAASKLYKANKVDAYKMAAVITHGNLYIITKGETSAEELKGKVVGVIGQGNVPDLTLKVILKKEGIEYEASEKPVDGKVAFRYFADASELMPMLKQGKLSVGLLPEPAATKLTKIAPDYTGRINVQTLYDSESGTYPQAVLMVKSSIADNNPKLIEKIENAFKGLNEWLRENTSAAVTAVNGALAEGVVPSLVAENIDAGVIDGCNIFWQSAEKGKSAVQNYLADIMAIEPTSAKQVTDEFFI